VGVRGRPCAVGSGWSGIGGKSGDPGSRSGVGFPNWVAFRTGSNEPSNILRSFFFFPLATRLLSLLSSSPHQRPRFLAAFWRVDDSGIGSRAQRSRYQLPRVESERTDPITRATALSAGCAAKSTEWININTVRVPVRGLNSPLLLRLFRLLSLIRPTLQSSPTLSARLLHPLHRSSATDTPRLILQLRTATRQTPFCRPPILHPPLSRPPVDHLIPPPPL
jgi:hypothetical protein